MKMRWIPLTLCCLGFQWMVAQEKKATALKIGDLVPDITFRNIINQQGKLARLSDYKGKLVILDIWSTYCTVCIAGFPHMEALQKEFGSAIQVLLVNPYTQLDSEQRIKERLQKNKERTGFYPSLPVPIHDEIIEELFAHKSVPHQVWISPEGRLVAQTGNLDMTKENIKKALAGNASAIPVKDDWRTEQEDPFKLNSPADASMIIYRSVFTAYNSDIYGTVNSVRRDEKGQVSGWFHSNVTLRNLVAMAYSNVLNGISENRMIFDVENREAYSRTYDANRRQYMYCYDVSFTPGKVTEEERGAVYTKYLQDDLQRSFNISVMRDQQTMKCYVVSGVKDTGKLSSRFPTEIDLERQTIRKFLHRYSVGECLLYLNDYMDKPLIDETGSRQLIDLRFPANMNMHDTNAIITFLKEKGFVIREEDRLVDVAVIRDK